MTRTTNIHEGTQVPMRDKLTGEEFTVMVVRQFEIAPMVQTQLRNYRVVNVTLKRVST